MKTRPTGTNDSQLVHQVKLIPDWILWWIDGCADCLDVLIRQFGSDKSSTIRSRDICLMEEMKLEK